MCVRRESQHNPAKGDDKTKPHRMTDTRARRSALTNPNPRPDPRPVPPLGHGDLAFPLAHGLLEVYGGCQCSYQSQEVHLAAEPFAWLPSCPFVTLVVP